MRHILVTNDDGVGSPGLLALAQALRAVGRVSVVAPDSNRSAIGRGITIHAPLHVEEVELADGSPAYATDGTPVDCVRFAHLGLLGERPDVIVSGINLGVNLGDDVTYSGTVAAALEGIILGLPAIAVSCDTLDPSVEPYEARAYDFRAAAEVAAGLVAVVTDPGFPARVVLSVNAPGRPRDEVRGVRVTRLGRRVYNDALTLIGADDRGRRRFDIYGGIATYEGGEGTDFAAVDAGEIAVTPLHFDLTDIAGMDHLESTVVAGLLGTTAR